MIGFPQNIGKIMTNHKNSQKNENFIIFSAGLFFSFSPLKSHFQDDL